MWLFSPLLLLRRLCHHTKYLRLRRLRLRRLLLHALACLLLLQTPAANGKLDPPIYASDRLALPGSLLESAAAASLLDYAIPQAHTGLASAQAPRVVNTKGPVGLVYITIMRVYI